MTYERVGWKLSILLMGGMLLLPLLRLNTFEISDNREHSSDKVSLKSLITYFKVKEFKPWIPVLLLIMVPVMITFHSIKPLLIDKGFTLPQVALTFGIYAMLAGMLAGLLAGYAFRKTGNRKKLLITSILNLSAIGAAIAIHQLPSSSFYVITACSLLIGAVSGINYMVVSAVSMEFVRAGMEGTDYAFQTFLRGFLVFPLMPLSGFIADKWGYTTMFCWMGGLALAAGIYVAKPDRSKEKSKAGLTRP